MNISLCICTYNRAHQLERTLESLLLHKGELIEGDEVLVIDNNSTDDTAELIQEYQAALPIKYVFESQQGLAAARNAGLKEFINPLIIFIDDDISVIDGFFQSYRSLDKVHQEADFFGGKIMVDWNNNKPSWFKGYDLPLINGLIGHYAPELSNAEYQRESLLPYGANFALRKRVVEQVGRFDINLGVKAEEIGRGEETDYFLRAMDAGFTGRYLESAVVFHRFQTERLTPGFLYRYGFHKGLVATKVGNSQPIFNFLRAALFGVRGVFQLLKRRTDRYYQCIINAGIQMGIRASYK